MSADTLNSLLDQPPSATKRAKNAKRAFEETLVTLTQLAKMVEAKPRALQLWTDAGALKPLEGTDRKGSGAWRLYSQVECELAAILTLAHESFSLPVGVLAELAAALRALDGTPGREEAFERARRGAHAVWLIATKNGGAGYVASFTTGAVLSLGAVSPGGASLRDKGAILVVNLTQALARLKSGS